MIAVPEQLLFPPGASGNTCLWRPAADAIAHPARQRHIGWPGFGDTPADPRVDSMDDLVKRALAGIDRHLGRD